MDNREYYNRIHFDELNDFDKQVAEFEKMLPDYDDDIDFEYDDEDE
jgi:hypothetical protein